MSTIQNTLGKMSNYRWTICACYSSRQQLIISTDKYYRLLGMILSNGIPLGQMPIMDNYSSLFP